MTILNIKKISKIFIIIYYYLKKLLIKNALLDIKGEDKLKYKIVYK